VSSSHASMIQIHCDRMVLFFFLMINDYSNANRGSYLQQLKISNCCISVFLSRRELKDSILLQATSLTLSFRSTSLCTSCSLFLFFVSQHGCMLKKLIDDLHPEIEMRLLVSTKFCHGISIDHAFFSYIFGSNSSFFFYGCCISSAF
jgi:hypothetical protein